MSDSFGEGAAVDRQVFDPVGIFHLFEGSTDAALLSAGSFGLSLFGFLAGGEAISRWRLAAVAA